MCTESKLAYSIWKCIKCMEKNVDHRSEKKKGIIKANQKCQKRASEEIECITVNFFRVLFRRESKIS